VTRRLVPINYVRLRPQGRFSMLPASSLSLRLLMMYKARRRMPGAGARGSRSLWGREGTAIGSLPRFVLHKNVVIFTSTFYAILPTLGDIM